MYSVAPFPVSHIPSFPPEVWEGGDKADVVPEVWEGGNKADVCLRYERVRMRLVAKCIAYKKVIHVVCQKALL